MNATKMFRAFSPFVPHYAGSVIGNPPEYSGWMDEQLSWKSSCYMGDWSFVPQLGIKGPDALRLLKDLSVNDFEDFPLNRAKHCIQCNEDGKVITEGILLRYAEDHFEYQCGTPQWTWYKLKSGGYNAEAYVPSSYKLQISGPRALELCEKLCGSTLRDVKFMRLKHGSVANLDATFLRQGMAGEIGFELQGPIAEREQVISRIVEVGQEFGMRRLGARNLMINHLEACYPTGSQHFYNALSDDSRVDFHEFMANDANLLPGWRGGPFETVMRFNFSNAFTGSWNGSDIRELYRSPVEMGWSRNVAFNHEFIGRSALENEVRNPRRCVVTLEFDKVDLQRIHASLYSDGPVYRQFEIPDTPYQIAWTDLILDKGRTIGHATHPGYSFYFRKMLALSFLDVEYATPGTRVSVLWGNPGEPQTELAATVRPAPFKADKRRIDLSEVA